VSFEPLTEKNAPTTCPRHEGTTFTDKAREGTEDQVVRTFSCGDVTLYRYSTPYVLVRARGREVFEYLTTGEGERAEWSTDATRAAGFTNRKMALARANEVGGRMQCLNLRLAMHLNDPSKVNG